MRRRETLQSSTTTGLAGTAEEGRHVLRNLCTRRPRCPSHNTALGHGAPDGPRVIPPPPPPPRRFAVVLSVGPSVGGIVRNGPSLCEAPCLGSCHRRTAACVPRRGRSATHRQSREMSRRPTVAVDQQRLWTNSGCGSTAVVDQQRLWINR